jgi:hypothetical protein
MRDFSRQPGMNGTGGRNRQFIRKATRPKVPEWPFSFFFETSDQLAEVGQWLVDPAEAPAVHHGDV